MLLRPRVDKLLFKQLGSNEADDGWFIYRPNWDGVWYQVANSPFYHSNRTSTQLAQVQFLHEAVICANTVLKAVDQFRSSGGALIESARGSNGSNWFLESFDKHKSRGHLELPPELSLHEAVSAISLALASEHYMQEELREHASNVHWAPFVLTTFQLEYVDYAKSLTQLIEKLQLLRWANLNARFPALATTHEKTVVSLLWLEKLVEVRQALASLRVKVVAAHGAARYFHQIKTWSVPGIGVSLTVLLGVLCGWPYLKWAADQAIRTEGFVVLYAAAIAAMTESSVFLVRLLWRRRSDG